MGEDHSEHVQDQSREEKSYIRDVRYQEDYWKVAEKREF